MDTGGSMISLFKRSESGCEGIEYMDPEILQHADRGPASPRRTLSEGGQGLPIREMKQARIGFLRVDGGEHLPWKIRAEGRQPSGRSGSTTNCRHDVEQSSAGLASKTTEPD